MTPARFEEAKQSAPLGTGGFGRVIIRLTRFLRCAAGSLSCYWEPALGTGSKERARIVILRRPWFLGQSRNCRRAATIRWTCLLLHLTKTSDQDTKTLYNVIPKVPDTSSNQHPERQRGIAEVSVLGCP